MAKKKAAKKASRKNLPAKTDSAVQPVGATELVPTSLVDELRELNRTTRSGVAQSVNSALVVMYWRVGSRIRTEVLKIERADYGMQICSTVSNKLTAEFGSGFSRSNLTRMLNFAELFPDAEIVSTLSRQLGLGCAPNRAMEVTT